MIAELSLNPSLPIAIVSKKGELSWANARMLSLIELDELPKKILSKAEFESTWPFQNDEKGPPAVLKALYEEDCSVEAHANLKNYRLQSQSSSSSQFSVITAELVRSGDLLQDKESRQLLFRVISHEVRTSVAALKGYTDMLSDDQAIIKERMKVGLERLERVVGLLRDLKSELDVENK